MTSSAEPTPRAPAEPPEPPALAAMWRLLKLGYSHEPGLLVFAIAMTVLSAVPDALIALWLTLLVGGVLDADATQVGWAAAGMAGSVVLTWLLQLASTRLTRRFRDKVTVALESHVATLQASITTIEHHERRDFLDRLAVLRTQVFVLDHMYMSMFSTAAWIVRLGVTMALLMSIHPALGVLSVFALPTIVTSSWRPAVERRVEESSAEHARLAEHLFRTATTASAGKEVRVTGIGSRLVAARRAAWDRWYAEVSRARWVSALWHGAGWAVFGLAYAAAVVFVASGLDAPTGDVLLVLAAGSRLSAYVSGAMSEVGFLRGTWLDGSRRLAWLEDYAAAMTVDADRAAPARIGDAITLDRVSFVYPGSSTKVLDDVSVRLPAGTVVALVGENGAGKSTLVKLLCQLYAPTSGEIRVDGLPLQRVAPVSWRAETAGAFQDFYRFEFEARTSIGLGDLPMADDETAVRTAVTRAGADDVVERLEAGLDTQLGPTWPDGVDLSFGQWQKVALARGFMRTDPLLLVLDEPTAALDAETEHALFSRYAEAARGGRRGGVTILVSHRFSTVRMADLIVVVQGARVSEVGSHHELMRANGAYAELYSIQARAYH